MFECWYNCICFKKVYIGICVSVLLWYICLCLYVGILVYLYVYVGISVGGMSVSVVALVYQLLR